MKSYRRISPNQSIDQFLLGKGDFAEWLRFNLDACIYLIHRDADKDRVRGEWEYEIEFSHKLWDIEFVVTGRPLT